jgi:hypothetical protein
LQALTQSATFDVPTVRLGVMTGRQRLAVGSPHTTTDFLTAIASTAYSAPTPTLDASTFIR